MAEIAALGQAQPLAHPNHYIILVDASFSTVENNSKNRAYHRLLHEELAGLLYESGFGKIPALVPAEDQISLLDFGIVTEQYAATEAYQVLHQFSFQNDFIHAVLVRRTGVTREMLEEQVTPRHFFRMTVLSWSRELAFLALRQSALDATANRTFLILVTDGKLNGGSSKSEIMVAEQHGNHEDVRTSTDFVRKFQDDYTFLGQESESAAFSEKYETQTGRRNPQCVEDCFYLQAYEVIPTKWLKWQEMATGIQPLGNLEVSYQDSREQPSATINATTSQPLMDWLDEAPDAKQRESLWRREGESTSAALNLSPSQLHLSLPGPLSCVARTFPLLVEGTIQQKDPLVGSRTVHFAFPQSVFAGEPESCRTAHRLWVAGEWGIAGMLMVVLGFYGYNRFFSDHIRVVLPGLLGSLPLHRRGTKTVSLLVPPQTGTPAIEVELPRLWRQNLFYPRTQLRISGEAATAVPWTHNQQLECDLPYHNGQSQTLSARWHHLPDQQPSVLLQVKDSWQTGTLRINFSHGWNSNQGANHE